MGSQPSVGRGAYFDHTTLSTLRQPLKNRAAEARIIDIMPNLLFILLLRFLLGTIRFLLTVIRSWLNRLSLLIWLVLLSSLLLLPVLVPLVYLIRLLGLRWLRTLFVIIGIIPFGFIGVGRLAVGIAGLLQCAVLFQLVDYSDKVDGLLRCA